MPEKIAKTPNIHFIEDIGLCVCGGRAEIAESAEKVPTR